MREKAVPFPTPEDRMLDALEADATDMAQMRAALEEIRAKAATMENGGAWAAGLAAMCLGTLARRK